MKAVLMNSADKVTGILGSTRTVLDKNGRDWWGVSDAPQLQGDFDTDSDVDGADFLVWQRNTTVGNLADWENGYGNSASLATADAVPEPSTWLLLSVGIFMLSNHRASSLGISSFA